MPEMESFSDAGAVCGCVGGDGSDSGRGAFSTTSSPLRLHPVLDHLLGPDVLLGEVLAYAGPAGASKLRNFPLFRERMARLNGGDLVRAGLLFCFGEGDGVGDGEDNAECVLSANRFATRTPKEDDVNVLRGRLLERKPRRGPSASKPLRLTIDARKGHVKLRGRPDWRDHRPTELCLLALAQHSLSSERCLRNIIRCLGESDRSRRIGGEYPAVQYGTIAIAIAENPASSESVLDDLFEWDRIRAGEAANFRSGRGAGELCSLGTAAVPDSAVLHAIAGNENASPRLLRELADDSSAAVRAAVASNERTPADVLTSLAADREEAGLVLIAVGRNPRTPERTLMDLSISDRVEAREAVAGNPRAPPFALQALASNGDVSVLVALSCNECLPPDVLHDLGRDERWTVRRNVAQHPNADPDVLRAFLRDRSESYWVRLSAAWNSKLTAEEVASLLDADDPSDRAVVAGTSRDPALLDRLARDDNSSETVRRDVAGNAFSSDETLEYLSRSDDVRVRVIVALNPRTPPSVLRDVLLTRDPDPHVRAVAVRNPGTLPEWLTRLAAGTMMKNAPPLDEETMEAIAGDGKSTSECLAVLHRRILREWPERDSPPRQSVLERLALNPRAPPGVLSALSTSDESVEVRAAVASHRGLPARCLVGMVGSRGADGSVLLGVARNATIQAVADHLSCLIAAV